MQLDAAGMELGLIFELAFLIVVALGFFVSARGLGARVFLSRQQQLPHVDRPRDFDWRRLRKRRNLAIRLPSNADSGKLEPIHARDIGIQPSVEVHAGRADTFSHDRRVNRTDYREILLRSKGAWIRIGARTMDVPLQFRGDETDTPNEMTT
jgi:hypothetical protein